MRRNRVFAAMLAVLMVVSLTACGRESVRTPGGELENGVAAIEDKSMETEEDQEGWMQEGASSPLLFLLRLLKSFLSSFILFEVDVYY